MPDRPEPAQGWTPPADPVALADRIVGEIGPRTVLMLGAPLPDLAAGLRERGVAVLAADGPDGHVPDLAIWCVGPAGLDEERAPGIVGDLCRACPDVLLVPSPEEGRPRAFWVARFGEHGLEPDPEYDARFLGPRALRFRRLREPGGSLGALLDQRDALRREVEALRVDRATREREVADLHVHLLAIQRSVGWKTLTAVRRARDLLAPHHSRRATAYQIARRMVEVMVEEGVLPCVWKSWRKLRLVAQGRAELIRMPGAVSTPDGEGRYEAWLRREDPGNRPPPLSRSPVISVITPVRDPEPEWLRLAIESVRGQTYPAWELCLVNDASTREDVRALLDHYATLDPRIRLRHLDVRQGIAGASNEGLALATGEFVTFLDHDDELAPDALRAVARRLDARPDLDLLYSDEDKLTLEGRRVEPFFKPGWSPDLLLSTNYVCHLAVYRRGLVEKVGGLRPEFDGSQDHDLVLRVTERTSRIAHIPRILYHWRKVPGSTATGGPEWSKPFAWAAGRRAIEEALRRRGSPGRVQTDRPGTYTVRYELRRTPLVSIVIPTRDRWPLLRECLRSIEERTTYPRYEVLVLDNDSQEPESRAYLASVARRWRVLPCPGAFNFSALNNRGAAEAQGEYLLFLNNDITVIDGEWLTALVEHGQRPEVGAVGAKLLYPGGRIQHAGVVVGVGGTAGHAFKGLPDTGVGYAGLPDLVRNCSAVTAACLLTRRDVFEEVGGFDEQLRVALNDVDLCLRLRRRGYLVIYTPLARLYHHESASRGRWHPSEDEAWFLRRWGRPVDPYYNPNLTLIREDWGLD